MGTLQSLNDWVLSALLWAAHSFGHFMLKWLTWSGTLPSLLEGLSLLAWLMVLSCCVRAPIVLPGMIWRVIQTNAGLRAMGRATLRQSFWTYLGLGRLRQRVRLP
jgi:hypothetical protein